jgi:four helix bundle protein
MGHRRDPAVLEAAVLVAKEVNPPLDSARGRLLHAGQLRKAVQSIRANIKEGLGRGRDGGRSQSFRVARGETEEAIEHLAANYETNRLDRSTFFRIRNRLVTIVKMLNALERS